MTDDRFDVHEVRHALKLRKDTGDTQLWENRKDLDCPACEEAFAKLLISGRRHNSFDPPDGRFCVVREPGRILVFAHRAADGDARNGAQRSARIEK